MTERQQILEEALFNLAAQKPTAAERAAFLDGVCRDNPALRARLDLLLEGLEGGTGFLTQTPDRGPQAASKDAGAPTQLEAARPAPTFKFVPESPDEAVGQTLGRYKLLERLGEGGCGVVYVAEQTEPVRRRVALKVIKLGMDTKSVVARFEAERQALAMMDHPNIAKVFDAGTTESGRPYFVMELVRGIQITEYCDQAKLTTQERLDLFIKVCQAIQHAHQKGIIHRDIKPSNILVTLHDGVPVPKVIDFGIAKATEGRLTDSTVYTQLHQFIGTPAYMSPEQAEMGGLDIDTRSDIYSLGVLLYELLAGKTPFDAKELMASGIDAMRKTIREQEPMRPSTRFASLHAVLQTTTAQRRSAEAPKLVNLLKGDLDWIVMKCLEKDRTRRYETANGLAADLTRQRTNEPIVARPPTTAYRLQKAIRRNKVGVAAGAFVAMALVVGIGISTWQAVVATRARTGEREQRLTAQTERDKAQVAQQEAQRAQKAETAVRQEAEHQLYAAKMNLAQQAWEENNLVRLRELLDDTQDSPYRGFEWYYWQQQAHQALRTLRGHLSRVFCVAYSRDGQRIATGSYDQTAKVWDAATGKELLTLKGHDDAILSVAFSADGQWIVTGGLDKTLKVWETASGREMNTIKGHNAPVSSVAFFPDGRRIVTGSYDQTVKVWDATNGKEMFTVSGDGSGVLSVALSSDGKRIVTGGGDKTANVWEVASGRKLLTLKGHNDAIWSVAFSPDGQRVVTGSDDKTAKLWDAANGNEIRTLNGHDGRVSSVAFSPDGQRIVTGGFDKIARVWDANSGDLLRTQKGHDDWISSVAFSPDGQRIVTGSGDKTTKVWSASGSWETVTLKGHSGHVFVVAFSADGQRIVTGGVEDKLAKVWEATSGRELLTLKGHGDRVDSVAFSPDGQRIATGSGDKTAKVWEATSGRELLTLKGHVSSIYSVAFSPDGQRIATGSGDKAAKVWDATSGRELLTLKGHAATVYSAAFSPDGQRIITGSFDGAAKVWDANSGRELLTLKGHAATVYSVAFSPDGQRIITAGEDKITRVWEAISGRELLTLKGSSDQISFVTFTPDGHRIAAGIHGNGDIHAKVWEAARASQVVAWKEEERAAVQLLTPQEQEFKAEQERQGSLRERSFLKECLVLAPIALAVDQSGAAGLEIEQIEGEGRLRPKVGEAMSIGGRELRWQEVTLEEALESWPMDFVLDFNALAGAATDRSVAYAVCYLRSDAPQRGLQLLVGSDDQAKIYLNGKEVFKTSISRPFFEGQDTVSDIALTAGINVLVFKVVNESENWKGSIRLTNARGNPVPGVEVTLDPEGKGTRETTKGKQP